MYDIVDKYTCQKCKVEETRPGYLCDSCHVDMLEREENKVVQIIRTKDEAFECMRVGMDYEMYLSYLSQWDWRKDVKLIPVTYKEYMDL